jgi:long-chain acyl-CoA synthetase
VWCCGAQVFYNRFALKEEDYNARVGDVSVSVLPCWHIFERTGEYWMYSKGIHTVYSNVKNFKSDLAKVSAAGERRLC